MWQAAAVAAALDIVVISLLLRRVSREAFATLKVWLPCVAGAVWMLIYGVASFAAWESCYQYVMPDWVRWGAWLYGLLHIVLGFLFWWIARRTSVHPVLVLAVLGGLHSLPGHLHGIYGRGLLERCPLVRGVSPAAALTFGVFEFAFYWMWVFVISLSLRSLTVRYLHPRESGVRTLTGA